MRSTTAKPSSRPFRTNPIGWLGLAVLANLPLACAPTRVPPPSLERDETNELTRLRDAFLDRVEALGKDQRIELPYRPEMREWTRRSIISWREEERAVAIPLWNDLDADSRAYLQRCGGRELFDLAFRWFFPIHELVHFLQSELAVRGDPAKLERQANDLAAAFFWEQPASRKRLQRFEQLVALALEASGPVPGGGEDRWFSEHYQTLARDPRAYGAFQWGFVMGSLRAARTRRFEDLLAGLVAGSPLPTAVRLDATADAGFHVVAQYAQRDDPLGIYDPVYRREIAAGRRRLGVPLPMIRAVLDTFEEILSRHTDMSTLAWIPTLVRNPAAAQKVFALLADPARFANPQAQRILERDLFPALVPGAREHLIADRQAARAFAAAVEFELRSFYGAHHRIHFAKWDWLRREFRDRWYREAADLAALPPVGRLKRVVIVLSPALRPHRKALSLPPANGTLRVAVFLPENPSEMSAALRAASGEVARRLLARR